jgi:hypothetical protein
VEPLAAMSGPLPVKDETFPSSEPSRSMRVALRRHPSRGRPFRWSATPSWRSAGRAACGSTSTSKTRSPGSCGGRPPRNVECPLEGPPVSAVNPHS